MGVRSQHERFEPLPLPHAEESGGVPVLRLLTVLDSELRGGSDAAKALPGVVRTHRLDQVNAEVPFSSEYSLAGYSRLHYRF
jgi:hypothetical protein